MNATEYREAPLHFRAAEQWRRIRVAASAVAPGTVLHAHPKWTPFGGGVAFTYTKAHATQARNRFICWRVCKPSVLEVQESSLDLDLTNRALRIEFPHPICALPSASSSANTCVAWFNEDNTAENVLTCAVLTVDGLLHHFVFPAPRAVGATAVIAESVSQASYIVRECAAGSESLTSGACMAALSASSYVLCTPSGRQLHLSLPSGHSDEVVSTVLQKPSFVSKLWSGFVPGSSASSAIGCIASLALPIGMTSRSVYCTVSNSGAFAVWDADDNSQIFHRDFQRSNVDSLPPLLHVLPPCEERPSAHVVVLPINDGSACARVYELVLDGDGAIGCEEVIRYGGLPERPLRSICLYAAQCGVLQLWVVVSGSGDMSNDDAAVLHSLSGVHANDGGSECTEWREVHACEPLKRYHDVLERLERSEQGGDVADAVLDGVFRAEWCDVGAVKHAALSFTSRREDVKGQWRELHSEVGIRGLIGRCVCDGMSLKSIISEAPRMRKTWCRFLLQYSRYAVQRRYALNLFPNHYTGLPLLVRLGSVSVYRPCSPLEEFDLGTARGTDRPSCHFSESTSGVFTFGARLAALVGEGILGEIERALESGVAPGECFATIASMLQLASPGVTGMSVDATSRQVSRLCDEAMLLVSDINQSITEALALLETPIMPDEYPQLEDESVASVLDTVYGSAHAAQILSLCVQQNARSQYNIARNVALAAFLIGRRHEHFSDSIVPRAFEVMKAKYAALWVSSQAAPALSNRDASDLLTLTEIHLVRPLALGRVLCSRPGHVGGPSLYRAREMVCAAVRNVWWGPGTSFSRSQLLQPWWFVVKHIVSALCVSMQCNATLPGGVERLRSIARSLCHCSMHVLVRDLARIFRGVLDADFSETLAECLLAQGEGEKAEDVISQLIAMQCSNCHVDPEEAGVRLLHLLRVVELHNRHDILCRVSADTLRALSGTGYGDSRAFSSTRNGIYSIMFESALRIENYDRAFVALVSMSSIEEEEQRKMMHKLVLTVVERGRVDILCRLPLTKRLPVHVDEVLWDRAQQRPLVSTSNISDAPISPHHTANFYYNALFAFHSSRKNFVRAAYVMFTFAERIRVEMCMSSDLHALQLESNCYLVALSALRLVRSENAHLVVRNNNQSFKRRRNGDEMELDGAQQAQVIGVEEIAKRYALSNARLQLVLNATSDAGKSTGHPSSISGAEYVELLVSERLYDAAFSLARKYDLALHGIFDSLAVAWVSLRQSSAQCVPLEDEYGDVAEDGVDIATCERMMFKFLREYDGPRTNYDYHVVVARRILSTDRRISLPAFLLQSFKSRRNLSLLGTLLDLYIQHTLLTEAADLASYMLSCAASEIGEEAPQSKVFLPYSPLETLLLCLEKASADPLNANDLRSSLKEQRRALSNRLEEYKYRAREADSHTEDDEMIM